MKVSAAGRAFITREEGTRLHIYADQVGALTIGTGHALRPAEKASQCFRDGITAEQADELLSKDLAWVEAAIEEHVTRELAQHEFDACASLVFNCGTAPLLGTLGRRLNEGDVERTCAAWSAWCHGPRKVVLPVLVARRAREVKLFRGDVG